MELSVLAIGGEFAGYRVESVLGRQSGIGRVYEATRIDSGERVALKVFKGREMDEAASRAHFSRFLEAQSELSHPNVVSVHEWGHDPAPYMVMDLVQGRTLADLLADGAITGNRALPILAQVAAALDAGRKRGLVYRRLQPAGILVGDDGSVKLGDFGAARGARAIELIGRGRLGRFVDYISPEEIEDEEATAASGIYSLGAIVFEALTGDPPFASEHEGETLNAHLELPSRGPGAVREGLPHRMDQAVTRALSKDPALRQRSAGELMEAVVEAYPGDAVRPAEAPAAPAEPAARERPRRPRRLAFALLALAAVAVAAALGAVAAGGEEAPSAPEPAKRVSTRDVTLSHPATWRVAREAPELAGLELSDPVALAPPGGAYELVAGRVAAGTPGSAGQLVDLDGVIGRRYTGLREAGSRRRAVAYSVPGAGGAVVAACVGQASGACERVASTVRPRREGAALAAASPSYARALNRVLRRLDRVRTKGRRRLARARTPAGQRRITARLSRDYATLAGVAARIDPPGPARAPQRVVVGQLRRASRGFRDMSRAARARSGRRWVAARAGVRSAEGNVQAALVSLRRRGYAVR
ncbi:MAG TPA: serine/threonine-protein kinase [Thermoleophilaceae bacterium]|nr:serine/threonine-protein kinase [Thermoleophilaceae bacterium]